MSGPGPSPSWRKPVGALVILGLIALWSALVIQLAAPVGRLAWPVQALFYLAAGIAWIWLLPLRRLLVWMETGRWRRAGGRHEPRNGASDGT